MNKAINGETAVGKESLSQDIPLIAGGSWVNDADGTLAIYAGDLNPNTAIFRTKTTVGTGTEATDHAGLSNLDYDNSGHTGFASAEDMEAVTVKLDGKANIVELDVTANPAPPALPRTNGWRIGVTGQVQGEYNYGRAFFTSKEAALAGDFESPELIAAWVIEGKSMKFAHILGGDFTFIQITDNDGNPLDSEGNIVEHNEYRPIPEGQTWWFSELVDVMQTGEDIMPFPTDDTFFSILEIGVQSLMTMIGDTFQLKTENKDLVGAVNELNDRIPTPPSSGNFTLTAVDGVLQWEAV